MPDHTPPLTGDNLRLLQIFASNGWAVTSRWLARHSEMLNYRARMTELRQRHGIAFNADWTRVNGKRRTTFRIPEEDRLRAGILLIQANVQASERKREESRMPA